MDIPDVPKPLLEALTQAAAGMPCALVGGVVRDLLLHRHHEDPWSGLPDLDLVVEGRAADFVQRLPDALGREFGCSIPLRVQEHGAFGTFELELEFPDDLGGTWLLDVASAREETYHEPGENPTIRLGRLRDDLARRDFTVNAMALELTSGELLDLHQGQLDLAGRRLSLLHSQSLRDDPTRLVRGARYAARLGFHFSEEALQQAHSTLKQWPWTWKPGDDPIKAPPALGTRLRMELELLFRREPWQDAIQLLQQSGGLALLDSQMQQNRLWVRRLHWAKRLKVPLILALVTGSVEPLRLASRLQLPKKDQKALSDALRLQKLFELQKVGENSYDKPNSFWCDLIESSVSDPKAVALAVSNGLQPRSKALHWLFRWRHVKSPLSSKSLIKHEGLCPGPLLGERLRQLRKERIDNLR